MHHCTDSIIARKNSGNLYGVTTVTTPGESVDVVITEYGVAVNPLRKDLLEAVKKQWTSAENDRRTSGFGLPDCRRTGESRIWRTYCRNY